MDLKQQVDRSGFPLQVAIAKKYRSNKYSWHLLYEEHHWNNDDQSGFIDLVLEENHKTWLLNIECKKVKDSSWIFLTDKNATSDRSVAKLFLCRRDSSGDLLEFDWKDIQVEPRCPQSSFCIVPGQDAKAQPMLERTAAALVQSTEGLAKEEAKTLSIHYSDIRVYQNVIVTTAELKQCIVDFEKINLSTGEIPLDSEFVDVPFIKFRKQLGVSSKSSGVATHYQELSKHMKSKESTIFIVNSAHLDDFLDQCDIIN